MSIDWGSTLSDAGTIAAISTAIFFVIDFVKKLYYKLPWGWVQKTPGEVWFALSIAFGIGVAIFVGWDSIKTVLTGDASFTSKIPEAIMGLISGAGSKVIHAIASPAGAKLQAFKLEHKAKVDAMTNGAGYIASGTGTAALTAIAPVVCPVELPIEYATPTIQEFAIVTPVVIEPEVIYVKRNSSEPDYIMIDGKKIPITTSMLELNSKEKEGE